MHTRTQTKYTRDTQITVKGLAGTNLEEEKLRFSRHLGAVFAIKHPHDIVKADHVTIHAMNGVTSSSV